MFLFFKAMMASFHYGHPMLSDYTAVRFCRFSALAADSCATDMMKTLKCFSDLGYIPLRDIMFPSCAMWRALKQQRKRIPLHYVNVCLMSKLAFRF